jgi:glycosyltransferase involved in cell wall biosynthesis
MSLASKKIVIVTNIPNPYRIPLFNELNKKLKELNIDLMIVFGASTYSRRKFKLNPAEFMFDYKILQSRTFHFGNNEKTLFTYSKLLSVINKFNPDKIIISGFSFGTFKIWWRSLFKKTNYIIWSGSILRKGRNDSTIRLLRKLLVKRASGFIAYGIKAKEYLISVGADEKKIFIAINTVETDFFANETKKLRMQIHTDDKKHLTFVGYLVARKNVIQLLRIVKRLAEIRKDFVLDLIGNGEQNGELEKFVREHGLSEQVIFHGFRQKNELPLFLAKSNCFLFQTSFDIWGLVLNEAMAAGICCLASKNAGSSYDLIEENENGYIIDFEDQEFIVEKLNHLLNHPEETNKIGKNASDFITKRATISVSAEGFLKAILN